MTHQSITNADASHWSDTKEFSEIFSAAQAAGEHAATACTPEPLRVVGYSPYANGECGCAYFKFDRRTRFGQWLVTQQHARSGKFFVFRDDQSADRATEYLIAFRQVLARFGIPVGPVVRRLD